MRQLVLNIPDKDYRALLELIRSNFQHVRIKEKQLQEYQEVSTSDDNASDVMLLSEPGLAEDWLSDEDKRWDDIL